MNVPRSLFFLGELNDQIYAVAGWTAVNEDTSTVERYSPKTDKWQKISDFPTDVHEHAGEFVSILVVILIICDEFHFLLSSILIKLLCALDC